MTINSRYTPSALGMVLLAMGVTALATTLACYYTTDMRDVLGEAWAITLILAPTVIMLLLAAAEFYHKEQCSRYSVTYEFDFMYKDGMALHSFNIWVLKPRWLQLGIQGKILCEQTMCVYDEQGTIIRFEPFWSQPLHDDAPTITQSKDFAAPSKKIPVSDLSEGIKTLVSTFPKPDNITIEAEAERCAIITKVLLDAVQKPQELVDNKAYKLVKLDKNKDGSVYHIKVKIPFTANLVRNNTQIRD